VRAAKTGWRGGIGGYLRRRWAALILAVLALTAGFVAGRQGAGRLDAAEWADLAVQVELSLQTMLEEPSVRAAALRGALIDDVAKPVASMWLLGLTLIGAPLILYLLFLNGLAVGFTAEFVLSDPSAGPLWAAALLGPHNVLAMPGLALAAASALHFAAAALGILLRSRRTRGGVGVHLLAASGGSAAAGLMLLGALLVETYVTPLLVAFVLRPGP